MKARATIVALLIAAAHGPVARADPDDYVSTPGVEYGEREVELCFGTASKYGEDRQSAGSIALGYGLTPWWFMELYGKFNRRRHNFDLEGANAPENNSIPFFTWIAFKKE